ncbi:MAG: glycosyltransferase family 2 protein, partial [Bdellovibrionales bacterium]|nr:glycosyltransferase family 2 protein [Bdellovibrionales bacterium]
MKKLPISLIVITLNEEKNIEACIRSAPFVNDIVILDSESQDRTREIALSCGARVYNEPFRGFRAQKERATEIAKEDWVLCIDADEVLQSTAHLEIESLFQNGQMDQIDGFEVKRANFHLGRWISHGGWYPDRSVRLFNKKRTKWVGGEV